MSVAGADSVELVEYLFQIIAPDSDAIVGNYYL